MGKMPTANKSLFSYISTRSHPYICVCLYICNYIHIYIHTHTYIIIMTAPVPYRHSWARDGIQGAAVTYTTATAMPAGLGIEPMPQQ